MCESVMKTNVNLFPDCFFICFICIIIFILCCFFNISIAFKFWHFVCGPAFFLPSVPNAGILWGDILPFQAFTSMLDTAYPIPCSFNESNWMCTMLWCHDHHLSGLCVFVRACVDETVWSGWEALWWIRGGLSGRDLVIDTLYRI